MNSIIAYINSKKHEELVAEGEAFKISRHIQSAIGLSELPKELNFPLINYRIIKTSRCFDKGWIDLIEINPIAIEAPLGYAGGIKPWVILRGGTAAINVPPEKVVNKFFDELKQFTT